MEQIKQLIVLIEQKNDEKLSSVLKDLKSIKDNNSLVDTDILKTLNEILNVSKTINKDDIEEIRNEVKTISESINKKQDNPLMEDLITAIKNIKIEQPSEISIKGMGKLKGATGEKGDKGDNGYTPIKGVDYFDGEKGEKGKDGSPDTPEQIVEKINTLENVIDIKTIKDFPVIEGTADIKRQMDTIGNQVLRLLSRPKTTGGGGGTWGSILGTLSNQTDLQNALNAKQNTITTGTTAQYFRGDLSLATFPTNVSTFTNDSGYITSSALSGYLQNNVGIAGGTTLIGGTASGDNLTLSSTSNATKGKILFGTSAYDEVNNRLGIGTTTPDAPLHVVSSSGVNDYVSIKLTGTHNAANPSILAVNDTGAWGGIVVFGSNYVVPTYRNNVVYTSKNVQTFLTNSNVSTGGTSAVNFVTGGYGNTPTMTVTAGNTGNVGIGTTSPTAYLHLKAGTATASTAPLKFTSGTLNTTAEAGVMEYNNTPHFTNSDATRRHIVLAPNTTKVTASAPYTNDGYIIINIGGTDFKVMTTA